MTTLLQCGGITLFARTHGLFGVDTPEPAERLTLNDFEHIIATSTLDLNCPDVLTVRLLDI